MTRFSIKGFRKGRIPNLIEELDGLRTIEYTSWNELVCFPEGVWKLAQPEHSSARFLHEFTVLVREDQPTKKLTDTGALGVFSDHIDTKFYWCLVKFDSFESEYKLYT